jgi:hypothetical protein
LDPDPDLDNLDPYLTFNKGKIHSAVLVNKQIPVSGRKYYESYGPVNKGLAVDVSSVLGGLPSREGASTNPFDRSAILQYLKKGK